jgi:chemotaxis protein methyltransferase CheR
MLSLEHLEDLITVIYDRYGYDFSDYASQSIRRRVSRFYSLGSFKDYQAFKEKILKDESFFKKFLNEVLVNVTEMFRDPSFFKELQNIVFPELEKMPFIRIWHAGCSTGEEVYSLAILLKEHQLLEKSRLYATDISTKALDNAIKASFPLAMMKKNTSNYYEAGGMQNFADYYKVVADRANFSEELKKQIVFSTHNLVSDQSFNEFHLIICRNVLIYFNKNLQSKVIELFSNSLAERGFLALGSKESIRFTTSEKEFERHSPEEKIWRKLLINSKI